MNTDNNNLFNFNFDVNNVNGAIAHDSCLVNNKFSSVTQYIQFINGSYTNEHLIINHTNFPVYDEEFHLEDETASAPFVHCTACPLFNEAINRLDLDRVAELEEGFYHLDKRTKTCDFASATVASSFAYLFAPYSAAATTAASHESDYATHQDDVSASALDALVAQTENLSINIDIDLNNINNEDDEDILFNEYCELNWEEFVARSAEFAALNYNRSSPVIPMTYVPSDERMQRYLH
jgi:hypothetical protein